MPYIRVNGDTFTNRISNKFDVFIRAIQGNKLADAAMEISPNKSYAINTLLPDLKNDKTRINWILLSSPNSLAKLQVKHSYFFILHHESKETLYRMCICGNDSCVLSKNAIADVSTLLKGSQELCLDFILENNEIYLDLMPLIY